MGRRSGYHEGLLARGQIREEFDARESGDPSIAPGFGICEAAGSKSTFRTRSWGKEYIGDEYTLPHMELGAVKYLQSIEPRRS